MNLTRNLLEELFGALGAHLEAVDASAALVVVGGADLALRGVVERTTTDVDVIARVSGETGSELVPAEPFPEELRRAASRVARDYALSPDWLNGDVGKQWRGGLPPGLEEDLTWLEYGGLRVGLAGRRALIALKLFAAVDQGPESVHWQDLLALEPTADDLGAAARWVRTQDAAPEFQTLVEQAVDRLRGELDQDP